MFKGLPPTRNQSPIPGVRTGVFGETCYNLLTASNNVWEHCQGISNVVLVERFRNLHFTACEMSLYCKILLILVNVLVSTKSSQSRCKESLLTCIY